MRISERLIDFVAKCEGFRAEAYQPIPGDRWTYGYGTTWCDGEPVKEGMKITPEDARTILNFTLSAIAVQISGKQLPLDTKQQEFDAVVSLVYNIGYGNWCSSDTAKLFHSGQNISNKFKQWCKSGGKKIPGLVARRLLEQKMYSNGDYNE